MLEESEDEERTKGSAQGVIQLESKLAEQATKISIPIC